MNLLLDTNVFIWMQEGNETLPVSCRKLIEDPTHQKYLSIASLWEIAIKTNIGKLEFDIPLTEAVPVEVEILDIKLSDLVQFQNLPLLHRDPFDRLIISQAIERNLAILSADERFHEYSVRLI